MNQGKEQPPPKRDSSRLGNPRRLAGGDEQSTGHLTVGAGPSIVGTAHQQNSPEQILAMVNAAFDAGQIDEAIRICTQAVSQGYKDWTIYNALGEIYLWLDKYEKGLQWLQKAYECEPNSAVVLDRVALALTSMGRLDDAVERVRCTLNYKPDMKIISPSLTEGLLQMQRFEAAYEAGPESAEKNLPGTDAVSKVVEVLISTKQYSIAEQWCRRILKQTTDALLYEHLGDICRLSGRHSEAAQYLEEARQANPDKIELWQKLAGVLMRSAQKTEGMKLLRKAIEKAPDNPKVHSAFLGNLLYQQNLNPHIIYQEHKKWAQIHAPDALAGTHHKNVPDSDRRLRIGYISPNFCMHSVAYFFEPLLDGHNGREVEVYGYGNVACSDQITERLKHKFDHYRNIYAVNDEAAVRMIEQDQIDILVDLAGHSGDNRLGVLAYKPAPVQVTYLGYPSTTGLQQIDYRLTDNLADTPQSQEFYTEKLVFLPQGFLCYSPYDFAPDVAPLPAVKNGYITFGSFNNCCKINPLIIALWAQILKTNENSRFVLKFVGGNDRGLRDHYLRQFEQFAISPERIKIYGAKSFVEHLQLYGRIDIALDTYPYNGATTTCEALWMGVPTISLVGIHHACRVGLSILTYAGLEFFAASTPEKYIAKATALAAKPQALAKIRASMRARLAASPLCDSKGFAHSVEQAYRKMWQKWCKFSS